MLGVILVRSLCHLATFLYEILEVRSNMMMAQFALMLGQSLLLVDLSQLSELLLAGGVPDLEENRAVVSVERNVGDIDTSGCCMNSRLRS